jgi:chorismate dehydratase
MISSLTVKIRIGHMPYLNCEPFYFGIDRERFEFQSLTPSAMTQSAKEGNLDAGPVPLVACFQMEDALTPVGDFCIATVEAAQSILLFSQRPIEEMEGGTFGITGETTTSVQLLKVLLHHRYHVKPKTFTGLEDKHDAFLVIGDNALRQRAPKPSHPYHYDLGHEWHSWTGYPFVFARWVMRRELPQETQEELREALQTSLEQGLANLDVIARKRRDLDMSEEEALQYLQALHYVIGPEETSAMNRFRELLYSLPT